MRKYHAHSELGEGEFVEIELDSSRSSSIKFVEVHDSIPLPLPWRKLLWDLRHPIAVIFFVCIEVGVVKEAAHYLFLSLISGDASNCDVRPASKRCRRGASELAYWNSIAGSVSKVVAILVKTCVGDLNDVLGPRTFLRTRSVFSIAVNGLLLFSVFGCGTPWAFFVIRPFIDEIPFSDPLVGLFPEVLYETESRIRALTAIGLGCAFLAAPLIFVAGWLSIKWCALVSALGGFLSIVYSFTTFPLDDTPDASKKVTFGSTEHLASLSDCMSVLRRNGVLGRLVIASMFNTVALVGIGVTTKPFMTAYIGMSRNEMVIYIVTVAVSTLISFALLPALLRKLPETRVLMLSLLSCILGLVLFTMCEKPITTMITAFFFSGPSAVQVPVFQSMQLKLLPLEDQHLIQEVLSGMQSLVGALTQVLFGILYLRCTEHGEAGRATTLRPINGIIGLLLVSLAIFATIPASLPHPQEATEPSTVSTSFLDKF